MRFGERDGDNIAVVETRDDRTMYMSTTGTWYDTEKVDEIAPALCNGGVPIPWLRRFEVQCGRDSYSRSWAEPWPVLPNLFRRKLARAEARRRALQPVFGL